MNRIILIVPAYKPNFELVKLIENCAGSLFFKIVIVNDGSGNESDEIFKKCSEMDAKVLHHCVNLGKGRALKTAFNFCVNTTKIDQED